MRQGAWQRLDDTGGASEAALDQVEELTAREVVPTGDGGRASEVGPDCDRDLESGEPGLVAGRGRSSVEKLYLKSSAALGAGDQDAAGDAP